MHNTGHKKLQLSTPVPVARCFMEYTSPFLFLSFLSLSYFSARVYATKQLTNLVEYEIPSALPFLPPRNRSEFERAVHAFYFIAR